MCDSAEFVGPILCSRWKSRKRLMDGVQHTSGRDLTTPVDIPTVSIPKVDHDNLVSPTHHPVTPIADTRLIEASYGTRVQYVSSLI